MAYTVGSASVTIVPDFRGAQLAITRWFEGQKDEIRVPVRPEMDASAIQQAETQARTVGNKLGEALAEGADRGVNRGGALGAISRRIAKLEADIEKSRTASTDAARQLRIAETRLQELRALKMEPTSARMLAGERAVAVAREKIIDIDRRAAEASSGLEQARRDLEATTRAEVEKTARAQMEAIRKADEARERADQARFLRQQKESAAEQARARVEQQRLEARLAREQAVRDRANETEVQAELRTAQRIRAEEERITKQAEAEAARQRERIAREEERWAKQAAERFNRALNQAIREAERERIRIEIDEKKALEDGRKVGNIVTRAIQHEVRQNAGLIAAAVGAALAFGGPAALAGATALFGGIATAAVAQSQEVRSTWIGLWDEIKSDAQSDAAVLVPTFERMAGQIGQSFQRMRPLISGTYEALGDQFEVVTASATEAAEKALPGLTRAIQNGMPVAIGFGSLLEDIGEGLSDFYDILGANSGTAGEVFSDLGGAMKELLPLLGELLNVGMETATSVLPALTTGFRGINVAIDVLGGILPSALTGLLAYRAVKGVSNTLENFSTKLGLASLSGGQFADVQRRGADVTSRLARVLPGVGIAAGVLAAGMAIGETRIDGWTQALVEGGKAAAQARAEMTSQSWVDQGIFASGSFEWLQQIAGWFGEGEKAAASAREEYANYLASLDPLSRAKADLQQATNNLSFAMEDESATGQDLADAQRDVAEASARVASEQEKLERATRGVTEAMVEQAETARARVDANFAYEQSLLDVQQAQLDLIDAQNALDEARASGDAEAVTAAELDLKQALLDVNTAYSDQLAAANERATSNLPAALDEEQRAIIGYKAELDELNALMAQGVVLPPSLEQYRQKLIGIVEGTDGAMLAQAQLTTALAEVGIAVEAIPGEKAVRVDALTDDAEARLEALGLDVVEMPDGSFKVSASTEEAKANLGNLSTLLTGIDNTTATPTVDIDKDPFDVGVENADAALRQLGGQRPIPKVDLDPQLLNQKGLAARENLNDLNAQRPTPIAGLNTSPFAGSLAGANLGIRNLDGERPTPVAGLNTSPFAGSLAGANQGIRALDGQRPTPIANMNNGPFTGIFGAIMARVRELAGQRPTPTVSLVDDASGRAQNIINTLSRIQSKTVTVTVRQANAQVAFRQLGGAEGGAIEDLKPRTYRYDGGGAVIGRGSSREDLIPALGPDPFARYRIANGEHILDGRDVALMGGQAGVYAFREMLNQGRIGGPSASTGVRGMLTQVGQGAPAAAAPAATSTREVTIITSDNPKAIVRTMRAEQQQHDALAAPWT